MSSEELKNDKLDRNTENIDSGYLECEFLSNSNLNSAVSGVSSSFEMREIVASCTFKSSSGTFVDSGVDLTENLSSNEWGIQKHKTSNFFFPSLNCNDLLNMRKKLIQICDETGKQVNLREYLLLNENGDTELHSAILRALESRIFKLIVFAPQSELLSSVNKDGHTPLHLSVITAQSEIVRMLVLSGAKLTARTQDGNTPLHLACQRGDADCVKMLLEPVNQVERAYNLAFNKGITSIPQDLEIKNYIGQTCLHIATKRGSVKVIKLLLKMGANLDAKEGLSGRTPLMIAIIERNQEIIHFFLDQCRPNFETKNYAGLTAYQVALTVENYSLAHRLTQCGAIPEPLSDDDLYDH